MQTEKIYICRRDILKTGLTLGAGLLISAQGSESLSLPSSSESTGKGGLGDPQTAGCLAVLGKYGGEFGPCYRKRGEGYVGL